MPVSEPVAHAHFYPAGIPGEPHCFCGATKAARRPPGKPSTPNPATAMGHSTADVAIALSPVVLIGLVAAVAWLA